MNKTTKVDDAVFWIVVGVLLSCALAILPGCVESPTAPTPLMLLNPDLQGIA